MNNAGHGRKGRKAAVTAQDIYTQGAAFYAAPFFFVCIKPQTTAHQSGLDAQAGHNEPFLEAVLNLSCDDLG